MSMRRGRWPDGMDAPGELRILLAKLSRTHPEPMPRAMKTRLLRVYRAHLPPRPPLSPPPPGDVAA